MARSDFWHHMNLLKQALKKQGFDVADKIYDSLMLKCNRLQQDQLRNWYSTWSYEHQRGNQF